MDKKGVSKLKLGVAIFISILLLSGTGFWIIKMYNSYIPSSEETYGWREIKSQEDSLKNFIPQTIQGNSLLKIYNEVEGRERYYINIGSLDKNSTKVEVINQRRVIYSPENKDPSFKMWVDTFSEKDYNIYEKESKSDFYVLENLYGQTLKRSSYKNIQYEIYRKSEEKIQDLTKTSSIGGANILFPEKNTAIFITFYNTKYQGCYDESQTCEYKQEEKILSLEEMESIIHQLIDFSNQ